MLRKFATSGGRRRQTATSISAQGMTPRAASHLGVAMVDLEVVLAVAPKVTVATTVVVRGFDVGT